MDFHDGRLFREMPKISLTQPQEGVWNLLLPRWILASKLFSTRAHRELQKDCTVLNWAEPFETRASPTATCFGERCSQKCAVVLLPHESASPEMHSHLTEIWYYAQILLFPPTVWKKGAGSVESDPQWDTLQHWLNILLIYHVIRNSGKAEIPQHNK